MCFIFNYAFLCYFFSNMYKSHFFCTHCDFYKLVLLCEKKGRYCASVAFHSSIQVCVNFGLRTLQYILSEKSFVSQFSFALIVIFTNLFRYARKNCFNYLLLLVLVCVCYLELNYQSEKKLAQNYNKK